MTLVKILLTPPLKKKKSPECPNLTYIDFEAGKAAKRLTESRCQDVTFTVVIPAGLQKTHKPDETGFFGRGGALTYNLFLTCKSRMCYKPS